MEEKERKNISVNEETIKFLLYSYFGIDDIQNTTDKEDIKLKCAHRAYLDLARTVQYSHSTDEKNKVFEDEKQKIISAFNKKIIQQIKEYPGDKTNFNEWHKTTCTNLINKISNQTWNNAEKLLKENSFTYGQAQKWLNMTLKYFWLLGLLPDGVAETDLHVPVDSYIIEAATSNANNYGLNINKEQYELKTAWSKWNDQEKYQKFQTNIDEIIKSTNYKSRIEWESVAWIEVAKNRAKK